MRLTIPSILATSLLLSACGGGDSAIDGAKDIPNRFGNTQNALDDFSSGSTGDSSNARGAVFFWRESTGTDLGQGVG